MADMKCYHIGNIIFDIMCINDVNMLLPKNICDSDSSSEYIKTITDNKEWLKHYKIIKKKKSQK